MGKSKQLKPKITKCLNFILLKRLLVTVLAVLTLTNLVKAQFPQGGDDIDWLIDVLELEKGSIVADIGAGDGDQTLEIARYIGPSGHIYSTELESELQELRTTVERADVTNVTVVEGHPNRTNLPEQCCNAIYLRRVYHHFDNPASMNKGLLQTLKPGGRLAVIDFEPRNSEADPDGRDRGDQHGVTAETVVKELKKVGFSLVSSDNPSGRDIYVVMEKPDEQ
jgi:ubiquinone/menaquinone biosynthesis C-methylase UbiE